MRREDYKRRKPLVLTPLRKQFMEKIRRVIYHYGETRGGWHRVGREGLLITHSQEELSVIIDEEQIVKYSLLGHRRTTWCSDEELKKALDKIDRIFLLDDLSRL